MKKDPRLKTVLEDIKRDTNKATKTLLDQIELLQELPRTRIYLSTNQTGIVDQTWTDVNFNAVLFDTHSSYSTNHYRYYAPRSGFYRISCQVLWANVAQDKVYRVMIHARGSGIAVGINQSSVAGLLGNTVEDVTWLSQGDQVKFMVYHNAGVNEDLNGSSDGWYSFANITYLGT